MWSPSVQRCHIAINAMKTKSKRACSTWGVLSSSRDLTTKEWGATDESGNIACPDMAMDEERTINEAFID